MNFLQKKAFLSGLPLFLLLLAATCPAAPGKAVVIVPVADMVGKPLKPDGGTIETAYQALPVACFEKHFDACKRIHQLLFNEVVTILKEQGDQVLVAVPNAFFVTRTDPTPQNAFWTLKKNLVPFAQLKKKKIDTDMIPEPLSFNSPLSRHAQEQITLRTPFTDPIIGTRFSAGTRFVTIGHNGSDYLVACYDHPLRQMRTLAIPANACVTPATTRHKQLDLYVELLREFVHKQGYIPYIWGGSSYVDRAPAINFKKVMLQQKPYPLAYYVLDGYEHAAKTGMDCSGAILRAAQMTGIPYYCKNTYTITQTLDPLDKNHQLANGDLIVIAGHVLVVSDIVHNTVIEARSYDHGFGRLQELPISKVFKGIHTFKDLTSAYYNGEKLHRIDHTGSVRDAFTKFDIMRMASVWD